MEIPENIKEWMKYEKNTNYPLFIKPAEIENIYFPENKEHFLISSYWLPIEEMHIFRTFTSKLEDFFFDSENVLFLVHPESLSFYGSFLNKGKKGPNFLALATSSYRTLLVYPENNPSLLFFAKLSLDRIFGKINRLIPKNEVIRSVGTTLLLKKCINLPENFNYLPEILGVIPKNWENGGMIIREIPNDIFNKKKKIIPAFSLYTLQENGKYYMLEMAEKANMDPLKWLEKYIFSPFAKQYLRLAINNNFTTEPHSQNLLIEIEEGQPKSFYFRDFNGFNFDYNFIKGTPLPSLGNLEEEYCKESNEKNLEYSLHRFFQDYFIFGISEIKELKINYDELSLFFRKILQKEFYSYGIRIQDIDFEYTIVKENILKIRKKIKNKKK